MGQALSGITKQPSGLFEAKAIGKTVQRFARNRGKNPMEVKLREASNLSQLTQLYRTIQILAKVVDDPVNFLDIFAFGRCPSPGQGFCRHSVVEYPNLPDAVSMQKSYCRCVESRS